MISVEFKAVREGTCAWCKRQKEEVYEVAFSDRSFVGPLCKGDLLRAIGMKVGVPEAKPAVPVVAAGNGNPK